MNLIKQLSNFVANIGIDYAVCGGHAIDLFLSRKTRPHKDLDAVIFWEDRDKLVRHMLNKGWGVYEPCGTAYLHKINDIADQMRVKSNIWCVRPTNPHYQFTEQEKDMYAVDFDNSEQMELDYIEFLFNTRKDGSFLFSRNHDIKLSLNKAIFHADGIPCLTPEVVLLYKSNSTDHIENQLDFDNAVESLDDEQQLWLKNALSVMFPNGHKWLDAL